MLQTSRDFSSNATARVLARCRSATERTGRPAATLPRAALNGPSRRISGERRHSPSPAQAMSGYASRRWSCTARSGTRKERPTRTAASSPAWTRRYTVIFETRIIEATSATVRKVTAARGAGTTGRPTGMAAGWAGAIGRAIAAADIGRPTGRGPGIPGRARAAAVARWGVVMSSSPDLAHVVAPASPPATEHACAATERKGTGVTGAMGETNRRTGPSWAEVHLCNTAELSNGELCDAVMNR